MLLEKEVFDKFTQLLAAGLLPTNAKKIHGLNMVDLLNLPIKGTEIITIENDQIQNDPINTTISANQGGNAITLFDCVNKYLYTITNIFSITSKQIDKKPNVFHYILTLKGAHVIKDSCILDHTQKEYNYVLNFEDMNTLTQEDIILQVREDLFELIKNLYINQILDSSFSDYDMLNTINNENLTKIKNSDDSDILNIEDTQTWLQDLINGSTLYIDFEFSIIDTDLTTDELSEFTQITVGVLAADDSTNEIV